jgi:hypothetical protein
MDCLKSDDPDFGLRAALKKLAEHGPIHHVAAISANRQIISRIALTREPKPH